MRAAVVVCLGLGVSIFSGSALAQQVLTAAQQTDSSAQKVASSDSTQKAHSQPATPSAPHKLGPLNISVNWRTRAEGWNWFEGASGNSAYGFWHSLLRIGIGQSKENFDWFLEGEQPSILGLPDDAVVGAPQGQLGLGGTYYAANNNHTNEANGFVKQAFVSFKHLGPLGLKIGRFEYFDGLEVKPDNPSLGTVIQTRIAHRLISNFGFTAVQRTFDGVQLSATSGQNNFTFFGARPTEGIFQVKGMDELNVDVYYGAYTRSVKAGNGAGELRVFALGYIDHRRLILKTDNRPQSVRAADDGKIELATYGIDYAHVIDTPNNGKFDFLVWGVLQGGDWGALTQRAASFVGEAGWQPPVRVLKPWISAGYSYGSGDGNPNDSWHGTFFQVLTTPRQYARFPFYNMMNNRDLYGTVNLRPMSKLMLRSEVHTLRLANGSDLWYLGGGAFQRQTFGYTGRPSNGNRGLANVWDLSADYAFTHNFAATLYYGHSWGKGVAEAIYPKDQNAQFIFLETNFHF
ncbi:MAG TPA: alginate export family protein [Silvibacterium sp.]|nr:alginate export family protein [Silvibacterium sp.]